MEAVKDLPKEKTLEEVKQQYAQTCAQLGELNYKEDLISKELARMLGEKKNLMDSLLKLNDEAHAIKLAAVEAEKKLKDAQDAPPLPPPNPSPSEVRKDTRKNKWIKKKSKKRSSK